MSAVSPLQSINCSLSRPPDISLSASSLALVLFYFFIFVVAFLGNSIMFLILCRNQWIKIRRIHSLLLHMNIAHLCVTLIYMPKEIIHSYTIIWHGGDVLCRVCKFFDVFGIALSTNVLICLSLDRFYSIFFPFYAMRARKSVKRMVSVAWAIAILESAPQLYLFKTAEHPCHKWIVQCVDKSFAKELSQEVFFYYSILNIGEVYFIPLIVTVVCYSLILWKIARKSSNEKCDKTSEMLLRRSGQNTLERAKSRTLKMTFVVVVAFVFCWTPYATVMFFHFLNYKDWIPKDMRKFIYAFAVFNSAISPYLYGYFSFDIKKELKLLLICSKISASDRHLSCSANINRSQHQQQQHSSSATPIMQRIRKRSHSACNFDNVRVNELPTGLPARGLSLRAHKSNTISTLSPANRYMAVPL